MCIALNLGRLKFIELEENFSVYNIVEAVEVL
jgi:hypothetical protein